MKSLVAFLLNCLVVAILSIFMTIFIHWLLESWIVAILAGAVMTLDGYFLVVHHISIVSGKRF
jgi:hypothetical protein